MENVGTGERDGRRAKRMTLAEAEQILGHVQAGRVDLRPSDARQIVDEANRRVSRGLIWEGDGSHTRTRQILLATLLLVIAGAIALIAPLAAQGH